MTDTLAGSIFSGMSNATPHRPYRLRVTTFGTRLNGRLGITGVMTADYTLAEVNILLGNIQSRDVHKIEVLSGNGADLDSLTAPGNTRIC